MHFLLNKWKKNIHFFKLSSSNNRRHKQKYSNMDKIIYNIVYNRKKRLNKKGTAVIQIEAYLKGKKKYFSTKIYLRPEQWDNRRLMVRNHPNAFSLNQKIQEQLANIEKLELSLWKTQRVVTLEALKELLLKGEKRYSFIDFYQKEVKASNLRKSSCSNHLSTLKLLQEFQEEVTFEELTFEFIVKFEQHLLSKGYHTNTIAKHMKHLKRYINAAINMDLMDLQKYAFRKYKIKTIESKHTFLTPEELHLLENYQQSIYQLRGLQLLDAFLFCCYAGLRYSDFVNLTADNIVDIKNEKWLIYHTVKTGNEVRLPLYLLFNGKAVEIIEKYKDRLNSFFQLPSNSNVNKELITIANKIGLKKHISFHTARHTNATLLIYNGVNITTVQKLLGHRSVKTTQVYTNIMDMTIIHDLEKIQSK